VLNALTNAQVADFIVPVIERGSACLRFSQNKIGLPPKAMRHSHIRARAARHPPRCVTRAYGAPPAERSRRTPTSGCNSHLRDAARRVLPRLAPTSGWDSHLRNAARRVLLKQSDSQLWNETSHDD